MLLEAMSYGLSCVASDIPANRNIDLPEERFFRAGDIPILSEKLRDLIQDPWDNEDREKQISMINDNYNYNYNWREIAAETLKVYRKIV